MTNLEEFKKDAQNQINGFGGWFILDNGIRNPDEIAEDIISFAIDYGFEEYDPSTLDKESDDYSEDISWVMDQAIEYLSNGVPEGYWIGNDGYAGAFGVWEMEEK